MIRKFAAALVVMVIAVGAVFAEEVKGTFVKFADGILTIKVDDKEKEYKVPEDLKVTRKIKGEEKEISVSKMLSSKRIKEGTKLILTTEGKTVKDVKIERRKK